MIILVVPVGMLPVPTAAHDALAEIVITHDGFSGPADLDCTVLRDGPDSTVTCTDPTHPEDGATAQYLCSLVRVEVETSPFLTVEGTAGCSGDGASASCSAAFPNTCVAEANPSTPLFGSGIACRAHVSGLASLETWRVACRHEVSHNTDLAALASTMGGLIYAGQEVYLAGTARNDGPSAAQGFTTMLLLDGEEINRQFTSALEPGHILYPALTTNWVATPGQHELVAVTDVDNNVTERSEDNNRVVHVFTVHEYRLRMVPKPWTQTINQNQEAVYALHVTNLAALPDEVEMSFEMMEGTPATVTFDVPRFSLEPGQTKIVSMTVRPDTGPPRTYLVYAVAQSLNDSDIRSRSDTFTEVRGSQECRTGCG